MGDAASDWDVRHDEASGQVYYWNAITGETSWEPPPHLAAAVPPPWTAAFDEDGRVYYLNAETMETRWTPPSTAPEDQGASDALATTGGRGRRPSTAEQMDELNRLLSGDVVDEPSTDGSGATSNAGGLFADASVSALQTSENSPMEGNTCAWMMFINESDGLPYYYNQATGECLWEPPEEFIRFHQEQAQHEESVEATEGPKDIQPPAATSTEDSDGDPKDNASSARPKSGSTQVAITPEFEEKVRRAIAAVSSTPVGSSRIMLVRTPTEQVLGPRTGRSTRSAGSARSGGAHSRPPSGGTLPQTRPPSGSASSRVVAQDPAPPQNGSEKASQDGAKEEESSGGTSDTEVVTATVQPVEQVLGALSTPDDAVATTAQSEAQESATVTEKKETVAEADEGIDLLANGNESQAEKETSFAELSEETTELPGDLVDATAEPVEQVVFTDNTTEPDVAASLIPDTVPAQETTVDGNANVVPPALTADTAALIVQCMIRCFLARRRVQHQRERRYRVSLLDAVAFSPDSAALASVPNLKPLPTNPEEDESRDETTSSSQSHTEDGREEPVNGIVLPTDPTEPEASLSVSLEDSPSSSPVVSDSLPHATAIEPDASPVSASADSQSPSGEPSATTNRKLTGATPVQPRRVYPTRPPPVLEISRYFPSKRSSASPTHRASIDASAVSITRKKLEGNVQPRVRHLSQHEIEKMEARHQENLEARRREEERAQRAKIAEYQQIYADARKAMKLEKQRILREKLERDNQRERNAEVERSRREAARLEAKRERDEERARNRVVGDAENPLLWELLKAPDRPTTQNVKRFQTALAQVLDAAQFADKMCAERARELQERIDQLHRASWAEDSHLESLELRLLSELHPLTDRQRPLQAKYAGKLRRRLDRMLDAVQAWQRVLDEWESGNGDVSSGYWGAMHARYLLSNYSSDGDRRQCVLKDWRGAAGGDSLLHVAASNGWVDHVRFLIEQGADVNLVDSTVSRRTPLHEACRAGRDQVVQLLLESGANPVALDCSGDSPLHMASRGGWNRVVRVLMSGAKSLEAKSSERTDVDEEPATSSFTLAFFLNLRNGKGARAIDVVHGSSLVGELEHYDAQLHGRTQRKRKPMVAGSHHS